MRTALILFLLLMVSGDLRPCVAGDDLNQERTEAEIWALETQYVTGFRDAAHDEVIAMWHPRFIGWPASEALPQDKQGVSGYLKRVAPVPGKWSFVIERAGIQILGDVAVTHFTLRTTSTSAAGAGSERASRITHTWVRTPSGWQLLGGMSARK